MDQREILDRLAKKEISQDEAERLLAAEKPGVDEAPPPVQPKKSGMSGCVIALLIMVPVGLLLLLGSCAGLFLFGQNRVSEHRDRAIMEMHEAEKRPKEALEEMRKSEETLRELDGPSTDPQSGTEPEDLDKGGTDKTEAATEDGE